ncbi:hypothetical protein G6011_02104 [Alternaria panax]|uniref:RBR-type E3 ubiquitin transferase n=1 Tax=Alternaria panax TaxID=48097 RepID=A0AAD4FEI4_9PLEO|nr:hypothetical protein G6011_02104 [Alternaria panax]
MDPATTRVVLKLQLDNVDAILKTLPKTDSNGAVNSERVAFAALHHEVLKKWDSMRGQIFAHSITREENAGRETYKKLLSEEQQAEHNHDMACRQAGKPVPQRPAVLHRRTVHEGAANQNSKAVNGKTLSDKYLCFGLTGMQTILSKTKLVPAKKRPAEDDQSSTLTPTDFKRARVDEGDDEDGTSVTPYASKTSSKKRAAPLDPAILREDEDGRTRRVKLDKPADEPLLGDRVQSAEAEILFATCSSCLHMHATRDVLQLPCKDDGDVEVHVYCRECLTRLFQCSIADTSYFPPRCCSKIISAISCVPFLPPAVFSSFVAKKDELEMVDRTYCSNKTCSNWVRSADIVAGIATCAGCAQKTCVTCKNKQHHGLCLDDKDVKELMGVAKAKRWQRCPQCKEMIELERGCYHIT